MVNTTLPIYALREKIVRTIRDNQVTILVTETGAGKSTQVCQYLLDEDYRITVTQPRRMAARTVSERVAEEYGTPFGEIVGFRTALERKDSPATNCLFVTDGLALVRELVGAGDYSVLIIDEVHEWNLNIEVLVAWARLQMKTQPKFKLVLMSATLEAERLSAYFDGAPIINAPGRTFPVEVQAPIGPTMEDDIARLLRQGHSVLVFQPGKAEIDETIRRLNRMSDVNAEILPLHGGLSTNEQDACFRSYRRPKCVVSTNVAQTSVTIPGITAVVDSGMERRIELVNGIEGLYLRPISWADGKQREGRAGRTEAGIYIDWCPEQDRPDHPVAEILRVRLDQAVLRLAVAGINMEELPFFHQPDITEIRDARRALVALGCMDKNGKVTATGRRIAKMPISVKYGRMIIEAEKLGVVDDVVTIAAILEQGGINARVCPTHKSGGYVRMCDCWKRNFAPQESTSDAMAQLLAYKACKNLPTREIHKRGLSTKAYSQARDIRKRLSSEVKQLVKNMNSDGNRENILRAIMAGMVDHVYRCRAGLYVNGDGISRELARESVVSSGTEWLVGEAFDLEIKARFDETKILRLVRMATTVNLLWLVDIAPHLVEMKQGLDPYYDIDRDTVASTTETWFNGQKIDSYVKPDANHVEAVRLRREGRNLRQWSEWTDRPAISLPTEPEAGFPLLVTHVYGADVETEEELKAYGFLSYTPPVYWERKGSFNAVWTRNPEEARRRHQLAAMAFEDHADELRAEARRLRAAQEIDAAVLTIKPLRDELTRLYEEHYYDFPREVRDRVYNARSRHISRVEQVPAWEAELREVLGDVRACLAQIEQRANEARQLRDKANSVILDHGKTLSDALHDELATLDVDDDRLPTHMSALEIWISRAEKLIAEAEQVIAYATQEQILTPTALSALRDKFNR